MKKEENILNFFRKLLRITAVETNLLLCIRKELMSKLDDLKADVSDYHDKVVAKLGDLSAQIAALQGQVGGVTDTDLQGVIDQVDAFKAELAPPAPASAPEPAPTDTPAS